MLKLLLRVVALAAFASPAVAQPVRSVAVTAADLVYSPSTGRLYASVTDTGRIAEIDPVAGTVVTTFVVGSQPNQLALSDDGDYLFVGLDGVPAVVRVHLPTRTVGTPFQLGVPDGFFGPRGADDIAVMPGSSDTIAVARKFNGVSPRHAGVAIYDGGVERTNVTAVHTGSNTIAFGASAGRLYGYNNETTEFGVRRMDVTPSGVTVLESTQGLIQAFGGEIQFFGGRLFGPNGRVIDPETRTGVATLVPQNYGIAVAPTNAVVWGLVTRLGSVGLATYDPATLTLISSAPVTGLPGGFTPKKLLAIGPDTLATAGNSQVFLLRPSLLPPAAPIITITTPTAASTVSLESSSVTLAGTAADANGTVVNVTWTSNRGYGGSANGTTAWTTGEIPLQLGVNQITVTATDSEGLTTSDVIDIGVASYSSFLAEGATGAFFDYDLALVNPTLNAIDADVTYFTQAGATVNQTVTVPAESRRTVRVDQVPGLENTAMSTSVRTPAGPILVERTMRWGGETGPQYGAHGDKATAGAALTWYFAEGAQGSFFTYLLLANPGTSANTATIDWLIEGGTVVQRTVNLPPASRTTIDAGADPALVNRSFGIVVTFAQPAVAERAMYFGTDPLFKAGHDSAGVTSPSTRWVLAEGSTGPFFETFILLANPNNAPADATLRFLTQAGQAVTRTVTIPARARRTIDIEGLDPAAPELSNAPVATVVTATLPIVAERAQYWPGVGNEWYEAHNSFGLTSGQLKWGLAEGRVGNPAGFPAASYQTYVLLANPGAVPATVTIRFLRESGAPVVKTITVPQESRVNVAIAGAGSSVPELADETFGATITSTQPIVVERALYGNAGAQVFGIGTNATATVLP